MSVLFPQRANTRATLYSFEALESDSARASVGSAREDSASEQPEDSAIAARSQAPSESSDDSLARLVESAGLDAATLDSLTAERVGVRDLLDALAAGDLLELLKDCGLRAGDRARLARELKREASAKDDA